MKPTWHYVRADAVRPRDVLVLDDLQPTYFRCLDASRPNAEIVSLELRPTLLELTTAPHAQLRRLCADGTGSGRREFPSLAPEVRTNRCCPLDFPTLLHVAGIADAAARQFHLPLRSVSSVSRSENLGLCSFEGDVFVKLRRRLPDNVGWQSRSMPVGEVYATLAHELAHLRCWEHGPDHRALTGEVSEWMTEALGLRVFGDFVDATPADERRAARAR